MNIAVSGQLQRFVVPNEANLRHDAAATQRERENTENALQVLALSIAEKTKEKEAAAQRPSSPAAGSEG